MPVGASKRCGAGGTRRLGAVGAVPLGPPQWGGAPGNSAAPPRMSEFVAWLEEHGWKMISASELPALIAQAAAVMPTFIIVPADSGWELQEYQDWKGDGKGD